MSLTDLSWRRHLRLVAYVMVCFLATVAAVNIFGLTRTQAIVYCVAAYIILNALNFRKVLAKS